MSKYHVMVFICLFSLSSRTESYYIAQVGLDLIISCFRLPSVGDIAMYHTSGRV